MGNYNKVLLWKNALISWMESKWQPLYCHYRSIEYNIYHYRRSKHHINSYLKEHESTWYKNRTYPIKTEDCLWASSKNRKTLITASKMSSATHYRKMRYRWRTELSELFNTQRLVMFTRCEKKLLTGIAVFCNLNIFPTLTIRHSKPLGLMKEREKRMSQDLIPGVEKKINHVEQSIGDWISSTAVLWEAEAPENEPTEAGN